MRARLSVHRALITSFMAAQVHGLLRPAVLGPPSLTTLVGARRRVRGCRRGARCCGVCDGASNGGASDDVCELTICELSVCELTIYDGCTDVCAAQKVTSDGGASDDAYELIVCHGCADVCVACDGTSDGGTSDGASDDDDVYELIVFIDSRGARDRRCRRKRFKRPTRKDAPSNRFETIHDSAMERAEWKQIKLEFCW
jgi:hypothetical protein